MTLDKLSQITEVGIKSGITLRNINVEGAYVSGVVTATTLNAENYVGNVTGNINPTTLNVTGVSTFNANIFLGDGDAAYFGDGQDLLIFHNSTDSIIRDNGTGDLFIEGGNVIRMTNPTGIETYATFNQDAAVELYYDGTKKFETTSGGASVTGDLVVSGIITSGTSTITIDGPNNSITVGESFIKSNSIGIGTTNPTAKLEPVDTAANPSVAPVVFIQRPNNIVPASIAPTNADLRIKSHSSNVKIYAEDHSANPLMILTGGGNLGIGTTNPTQSLHAIGNILSSGSIDAGTQFLGQANDSAASPSYSWTGDTNTGFFRPASDQIAVTTAGSISARFTGNDFEIYQDLRAGLVNGVYSSGENGNIISYARNTSTHADSAFWTAYAQLLSRYTVDDVAIFQHITRDASQNETVRSAIKANGRATFSGPVLAGRTETSTTGTPTSYYPSGETGVYSYGRNSSLVADTTKLSSHAAMVPRYVEDSEGVYYHYHRSDGTNIDFYTHNLTAAGASWHYSTVYSGRSASSSTAPTYYYRSGEHGFNAYAGSSTDVTYIAARNTADASSLTYEVRVTNASRIKFTSAGNGYWDGAADLGAADYAEYFEWEDGNPNNEDRVGKTVVLVNEKIRLAIDSDNPALIFGVVSGRPAVVGDSASLGWQGRFKTDEFNRRIKEPIEVYEYIDSSGEKQKIPVANVPPDKKIPEDWTITTVLSDAFSEEYDPDQEYIPRSERPEWDPIGLMGKLTVYKGQPVGDRWIKMKDINDQLEQWLVR